MAQKPNTIQLWIYSTINTPLNLFLDTSNVLDIQSECDNRDLGPDDYPRIITASFEPDWNASVVANIIYVISVSSDTNAS